MILSFLGKMIKNVIESVVNLICTINQICALPNLIGLYYITSALISFLNLNITTKSSYNEIKINVIQKLFKIKYYRSGL